MPTKTEDLKDDRSISVPFFSEVCSRCANKHEGVDRTCKAFPQGIPMVIWLEKNNHKKPYPGDMGITFEPVKV